MDTPAESGNINKVEPPIALMLGNIVSSVTLAELKIVVVLLYHMTLHRSGFTGDIWFSLSRKTVRIQHCNCPSNGTNLSSYLNK